MSRTEQQELMAQALREELTEWRFGEWSERFANRLRVRKHEIDSKSARDYIRDTPEMTQRAMERDLAEAEVLDEMIAFFEDKGIGRPMAEAMIDDGLGISEDD